MRSLKFAMCKNLPTKAHKKAWLSVERLFIYRSNTYVAITFFIQIIRYIEGKSPVDLSRDYIKNKNPYNEYFVAATMDHIERILLLFTVSLPILLLLNVLNKNVCKYYPIVFALRYTLVLLLPRDYGDTANDFIYLQIISTFIMTVFNLWVSAFAFMVPVGASIAA